MNLNIRAAGPATVVEIVGELDASTAPTAQQHILLLAKGGGTIVLDMSGVTFMSSAGLRLLLLLYRQVAADGGRLVLAGLSEQLQDTMSMTGFLNFFSAYDSVDAGLKALGA